MRLKHKWNSWAEDVSIEWAVKERIEDSDGGVAERADQIARQAAEYLGELTELLHGKGLLTDGEVLSLVTSYERLD